MSYCMCERVTDLAAGGPHVLGVVVGRVCPQSAGVNPGQLLHVVSNQL